MEEKYKLYLNLIKEDKNQTLIVFPQIPDIYNFYQYLNKTWRKKTAIINHQLSDSQLYHIYEKVAQGKIKVILGTSLAFFLPYKNLKTVVIDEEDNKNHKQYDQNPRFHNKIVAEKIFSLYKTRLILTSACPNITTYFQAKKGRYKLYKSKEKAKPKSTLVDLTRSNRGGKSFLSIFLKNEIENKLNDKKKILLLNNRKGFSRTSVCRDCGYTANCPDCQIPLTQHKKSSGYYLLCHRCGFQRKMILKCPNCGSAEISSLGLGQEKIFEEISNLFPKVKITKISSQSETSQYLKKSEIVISTFIALSRFIKNKFGLIVLVNADQILNLPDYRSSEKTFQLLFNLNCLARYNQADFIIQTYSAKNSSFKYFPNRYENFFRQELKNRKLLNYPPYSQLIKLSSQAQSPYQAKKEALDIHHKISNKFSSLSLSPPLPAFRLKRFDRYFYNIILKLPKNIKHKKLQSIIKLVPDHWLIDRNPENLL